MGKRLWHHLFVFIAGALALGLMQAASFGQDGENRDSGDPSRTRFVPERLVSEPGPPRDDWEPSVAADDAGHVYIAVTRFDGPKACPNCPRPAIVIEISSDGGRTWSGPRFPCRCSGVEEQFDPALTVDEKGRVFATWMNDFDVHFSRSDDFGRSWTKPVSVDGRRRYSDKPWIGVSDSGKDVYITFNGPGNRPGAPYTVSSHDAGKTWSRPVGGAPNNTRYWFAGGLAVTPKGTAISSQSVYPQNYKGPVSLRVLRSPDGGDTWRKVRIAQSKQGRRCPKGTGCGLGFFGPQMAIAADDAGRVYVLWNETNRKEGPARVYLRWSDDEGKTWSPARKVSSAKGDGVDSEFPMIAATGQGDVRIAWMDDRTSRWNTWYRRSTDGGFTLSGTRRLSNRSGGAPYKSPKGFEFPYGDYGHMAIDGDGMTHAVWGEAPDYIGPGGVWYTRSR